MSEMGAHCCRSGGADRRILARCCNDQRQLLEQIRGTRYRSVMGDHRIRSWQDLARAFFVPVLAYLLAAHAVLYPIGRAHAIERAGLDQTLAVLCLTGNLNPSHSDENIPEPHRHDLGCCTLASRLAFEPALAVIAVLEPLVVPVLVERVHSFTITQSRTPPAIIATPIQSRGPPSHT